MDSTNVLRTTLILLVLVQPFTGIAVSSDFLGEDMTSPRDGFITSKDKATGPLLEVSNTPYSVEDPDNITDPWSPIPEGLIEGDFWANETYYGVEGEEFVELWSKDKDVNTTILDYNISEDDINSSNPIFGDDVDGDEALINISLEDNKTEAEENETYTDIILSGVNRNDTLHETYPSEATTYNRNNFAEADIEGSSDEATVPRGVSTKDDPDFARAVYTDIFRVDREVTVHTRDPSNPTVNYIPLRGSIRLLTDYMVDLPDDTHEENKTVTWKLNDTEMGKTCVFAKSDKNCEPGNTEDYRKYGIGNSSAEHKQTINYDYTKVEDVVSADEAEMHVWTDITIIANKTTRTRPEGCDNDSCWNEEWELIEKNITVTQTRDNEDIQYWGDDYRVLDVRDPNDGGVHLTSRAARFPDGDVEFELLFDNSEPGVGLPPAVWNSVHIGPSKATSQWRYMTWRHEGYDTLDIYSDSGKSEQDSFIRPLEIHAYPVGKPNVTTPVSGETRDGPINISAPSGCQTASPVEGRSLASSVDILDVSYDSQEFDGDLDAPSNVELPETPDEPYQVVDKIRLRHTDGIRDPFPGYTPAEDLHVPDNTSLQEVHKGGRAYRAWHEPINVTAPEIEFNKTVRDPESGDSYAILRLTHPNGTGIQTTKSYRGDLIVNNETTNTNASGYFQVDIPMNESVALEVEYDATVWTEIPEYYHPTGPEIYADIEEKVFIEDRIDWGSFWFQILGELIPAILLFGGIYLFWKRDQVLGRI